MERIVVTLGERSYPITIASGLFNEPASFLPLKSGEQVMLVTNETLAPLYLDKVRGVLEQAGVNVDSVILPDGEQYKSLAVLDTVFTALLQKPHGRDTTLVALGGGVVGDLTGFTAATYLRGIRFIQIPTSLLAQVDSSIGGKTGVDFRAYKNMVGAFHQPKLVYSCAETLKTLTSQQYISGLGEIIKHGLIKDAAYYEWLKAHKEAILSRDTQTVIDMIAVSCHIKKEVVENDPEEAGERALLNFGHTLGHAVEKLMNFTMLHGECVAVGMHAAAWLSMEKGMLTEAAYKDITDTIVSFGLPVSVKGLEPEQIVAVSKSDKKMDKGRVKFILLDPEGHAVIDRSIRDEQLLAAASIIVRNGEHS